ncbi:MAG TPA: TetR/AcrR family transcriptional regulator [Thermotogota bacterium]|nr:TetR/AcrR family transcriptional regulator [Thermotogota bacterium]HPJ89988.1 TetR/AcrR family transcriptional regulator [Thermotogota bacterium]HPR97205.1 TetR/AcrR family transcriptional regulator [Thermotogota bacterium]
MATKKAEKILNTTIKLFLHKDIRKITMDEIAAFCNVSKVTLYKYFTDKDTLLFNIGRVIFSDYQKQLEVVTGSDEPLKKKLYDFLAVITEFKDCGKLDLCRELAKCNIDVTDEYKRYLETYKQSMMVLIDSGIEEGMIKKELNREHVFHYIDMGVIYYQKDSIYRNRMLNDHQFQLEFLTFFINNIFADESHIL